MSVQVSNLFQQPTKRHTCLAAPQFEEQGDLVHRWRYAVFEQLPEHVPEVPRVRVRRRTAGPLQCAAGGALRESGHLAEVRGLMFGVTMGDVGVSVSSLAVAWKC